MISLARDPVGEVPSTNRIMTLRGAYVIQEVKLTLVSCGSNLHHTVAAARQLLQSDSIHCRIVSCPGFDLFDQQSEEYRTSVLPLDEKPIVSVEEYVATTWARYVTSSIGMKTYGYSVSNESNYERFGLDAKGIVFRLKSYLTFLDGRIARERGWRSI